MSRQSSCSPPGLTHGQATVPKEAQIWTIVVRRRAHGAMGMALDVPVCDGCVVTLQSRLVKRRF